MHCKHQGHSCQLEAWRLLSPAAARAPRELGDVNPLCGCDCDTCKAVHATDPTVVTDRAKIN